MKNKEKVHIISHTHWDREWYLPYEKHHVQLIRLMDQLLDTLENDPEYKNFHLDGQTIILDDYLQVRPEMREKVAHFVREGRIQVGPWYILQDEFLTSSEANIRNLQYGMRDAAKWTDSIAKVGYFPDSFGNIGQAPQILKQAGINNAVFGRGVKPTGFNNTVMDTENYESPYSEMRWESPDGSSVLGILFANWYCNGNEVPVDETKAKAYWEQHLDSLRKYASTPHLLMMNGCDHQPIQTDLSKAVEKAKELYPEIDFVHSTFNDYIREVSGSVTADLKTVKGELRSQQTDGWGTLVNTASSRLYLKQMNQHGQALLEKVAEPLATFAYMHGEKYPHDLLAYAWKTLMQNHPHDSICGCSVDEVHREMVTRFEKSKHVTEVIVEEGLSAITNKIDTSCFTSLGTDSLPFAVYNTTGSTRTGVVTVTLDVKREYFSDGVNKQALADFPLGDLKLVDESGQSYESDVVDLGISFDYDLPSDKFRQPYMVRRVMVTFEASNIPASGYQTYALVPAKEAQQSNESLITGEKAMENAYLHVAFLENGAYTVTDKTTGKIFDALGIYEDTGDLGNEYMYKQANEQARTTNDVKAAITIIEDKPFQATFEITHEWELPRSAADLLEKEQREVVWFTGRKAGRSDETIPFTIKTQVTLEKHSRGVNVTTTFDNQVKDHRLRVLFPTNIQTDIHTADAVFEAAVRANTPDEGWTNPDHSQHQQAFVDVSNDREGLTIANKGLAEYELLRDGKQTIAITLLRAVGEMGDWGHFPTPEAQCLGEHTVSYRIYPHQGTQTQMEAFEDAYQYQVPWSAKQAVIQEGTLPATHAFVKWEANHLALSSIKVSEGTEDIMIRWFNMGNDPEKLKLHLPDHCVQAYESNVMEENKMPLTMDGKEIQIPVRAHEIMTVGLEK